MSEIGDLLAQYQGDGEFDSAGEFRVDLQRAYQQLGRHVFSDANEYILKLVQAANLLQTPLSIDHRGDVSVIFESWPAEYGVHQVVEWLFGFDARQQSSPLGLLAQAVRGLLDVVTSGLTIRHTVAGVPGRDVLFLGSEITVGTESALPTKKSRLRLSFTASPALKASKTGLLLKTRCQFSAIPISFDGQPLPPMDSLDSSGAHRPRGFKENRVLAQSRRTPYRPFFADAKAPLTDRWSTMRLTVDLNPLATVWFCAAGVLTHQSRLNFGVPGVTAVVAADDLPTDLGGFRIRETEQLRAVESWLHTRARRLMAYALKWLQSEQGLQDRRFAKAREVLVSYIGFESDDFHPPSRAVTPVTQGLDP